MRLTILIAILLPLVIFCLAGQAHGSVSMPAIFADGMVLQRGMEVPVWGKAAPAEEITVEFAGQTKTATTGADGLWIVRLDPLEAGGPYDLKVTGADTRTFSNVMVGEVWLASGQSNMAFDVIRAQNGVEEVAAANHPLIRLCTVPEAVALEPQLDCTTSWAECSPESVRRFSAAAYYFGRELKDNLNVPIGLIDASWSGSVCEAWIRREVLDSKPELATLLKRWRDILARPEQIAAVDKERAIMDKWAADFSAAKAAGKPLPVQPESRRSLLYHMDHPANLYNGMIAPVIPFAVRGVIWYQGEGNSGRAYQYRILFPTLIYNWRADWGQGDFPFLFVQLASFRKVKSEPAGSNWAEVREIQLKTLSLPNTGMAVAVDIGNPNDPHPLNKQDVGKRLALAARALVYGEKIVYSGPIYRSMTVEGSKARIAFNHVGGGLVARRDDSGALACFEIAGRDGKFVWADARIDGDTVVVRNDSVGHPAAVRYAWQDNPGEVNFYNAEGLPASPFRTDDFPSVTTVEEWPASVD